MAECLTDKFIISKTVDNTFIFTIKADGTTLPMVIEPTDTFVASLQLLSDSSEALSKALTHEDLLNGKVSFLVTEAEAATLVSDKGSKVDRYYLLPTYKLVIDCVTTNNGNFIAKVCEVYVD